MTTVCKRTVQLLTLALLFALTALILALPKAALALDNVPYLDANGVPKTADNVTVIDNANRPSNLDDGGWYLVRGNVQQADPMGVTGTAHLILEDDCILSILDGLWVTAGNTLHIYAQSTGVKMGKLDAFGGRACAGIGGGGGGGGTVIINGGTVTATGGDGGGAGIGGGNGGSGGATTINGGTVVAKGGDGVVNGVDQSTVGGGAGIGGGGSGRDYPGGAGGTTTINGANSVTATGGDGGDSMGGGAGIGGGAGGSADGGVSGVGGAAANVFINEQIVNAVTSTGGSASGGGVGASFGAGGSGGANGAPGAETPYRTQRDTPPVYIPTVIAYTPEVAYNPDGSVTLTVGTTSGFNGLWGNAVVPSSGYTVQIVDGKTVITIDAQAAQGLHGQRLTARFASGTATFTLNQPAGTAIDLDGADEAGAFPFSATTTKNVNVYGADDADRKIDTLKRGADVKVLSIDEKWATVEYTRDGETRAGLVDVAALAGMFGGNNSGAVLHGETMKANVRLYTKNSRGRIVSARRYYPDAGSRVKLVGLEKGYWVTEVREETYFVKIVDLELLIG